jgi:Putative transposase/Phage integrase family
VARIDKTLDAVGPEEVAAYQRYLVTERKVGFSSFNQSTCALRFFCRECLGKTDWTVERMPFQRKRRTLPEILSPEEIAAILDACHNLKHRAVLMTSYSGGLRLGETLGLLPSDIDSTRMMIRIEQGKGRKDRCVMLSKTLLDELRVYWKASRRYFQIVFTIPKQLRPFFRRAPRVCLTLLFEAVSETLLEVARGRLKATIGFTAVLHTWNQPLGHHPHLHCVVPAGGLSLDGSRWIATSRRFFLHMKRLRKLFRGKLLSKLEQALRSGEIHGDLAKGLALLRRTPDKWNVYVKRPLAGPSHVVRYLSRYVHRIAIADSRITDYDGANVTFRYKDRAAGNATAHRTVSGPEFAQLFLQHVLPTRFVRIRHYGILAVKKRRDLARCRELLGAPPAPTREKDASWVTAFERLFGQNPLRCPACKTGTLVVTQVLAPMRM